MIQLKQDVIFLRFGLVEEIEERSIFASEFVCLVVFFFGQSGFGLPSFRGVFGSARPLPSAVCIASSQH
jgi:hypothetical protein